MRRSTTQQDSRAVGLGLQQSSTALALRSGGSQALVLSGAHGGELALLDEADVPRAEHQLRQKVMRAISQVLSLDRLSLPPLHRPAAPPPGQVTFHHDQTRGRGPAQAEGGAMHAASEPFAVDSPLAVTLCTSPHPFLPPPFPCLPC